MTAWEAKTKSSAPRYAIFADALQAGIDKLNKYYNRFDLNPCIIVNLGTLFLMIIDLTIDLIIAALHPYFKLDWIALHWGGAREQERDRAQGDINAKNWQDESRKILENLVWLSHGYNDISSLIHGYRWRNTGKHACSLRQLKHARPRRKPKRLRLLLRNPLPNCLF